LLDLQSKNKLAQKLLACRSFKDRQLRNTVIWELNFSDRIVLSVLHFTMSVVWISFCKYLRFMRAGRRSLWPGWRVQCSY